MFESVRADLRAACRNEECAAARHLRCCAGWNRADFAHRDRLRE